MSNKEKKEQDDFHDDDLDIVQSYEDGQEVASRDKLSKLKKQLADCRKEKQENLDGWQRARAEYVNLQKETTEKLSRIREDAVISIIHDFLPTLDSFDSAMGNKEAWENVDKNWRIGVEYIHQQMVKVLTENGIEKIDESQVDFQSDIHEPLGTESVDSKKDADKVLAVKQAGYRKGDRIIRPAKVIVSVYEEDK